MNWNFFYWIQLSRNVFSREGAKRFLAPLGVLNLLLGLISTLIPKSDAFNFLQENGLAYLIVIVLVSLIYCLWNSRPILTFICRPNYTDTAIELKIAELFEIDGDIVIGSNTTFETQIADNRISPESVQGQFTVRYFRNSVDRLDSELLERLKTSQHVLQEENTKTGRRTRVYPIGTVSHVDTEKRTGYFLAIAAINEHWRAEGSLENVQVGLGELWPYIEKKGKKGTVIVPILGTGFSRITTKRTQVIQEIILSALAACKERSFCNKLIIAIRPSDVTEYKLDFKKLTSFLEHESEYHQSKRQPNSGSGTATS